MKKYCIVIPHYTETLNPIEEMCLKRINTLYKDSDVQIYLVYPTSINTSAYKEICPKLKFVPLDDKYFKSTETYSELCMSHYLYDVFSQYEYMLLCQLDAFMVSSDIEKYCDMGYDYIGAPIYANHFRWGSSPQNPKVGNGGFSLRKISKFKEITSPEFVHKNKLSQYQFEDVYFCVLLNDVLNIAPADIAGEFACDQTPLAWQKITGLKYPVGIHAIGMCWLYWFKKIPEMIGEPVKWAAKHYNDITVEC